MLAVSPIICSHGPCLRTSISEFHFDSGFPSGCFSRTGAALTAIPQTGVSLFYSLSATTKLYHNIFPLCSLQRSDFMRFPRTFLNRLNDNRLFVILTSSFADDIIALYVIEVAYFKSSRSDASECRGRRGERDLRRKKGFSAVLFLGVNQTGSRLSSSDGALSADHILWNIRIRFLFLRRSFFY